MSLLVLVRHGQSVSNLQNVFTGSLDVALTPKGEQEAQETATKLRGFHFDTAFCSDMLRARRTLDIMLRQLGQADIPTHYNAALNERYYGNLQGLNKADTVQKYGEEQVDQWRRSYDVAPPGGESLHQTQDRVVAYYEQAIARLLQQGQHVLVVAHGNSLRALRMYLEHFSAEHVKGLEIPTGGARVYELDNALHIKEMSDL
ncbi:2,3-bisphosphoglycerate-dependent phosphoglycerate mutase [Hymenobacter profundi]|uniref:2,3-bisphosphoglycerate-dependent phosphoglycerate mutase n=1 Tax=Hymenobacter profundi TaxID=1982110 RepID=A0ABS6X1R0_9BACT|nr:2,3-bisphosphoglycerate-dependent phosphoglycerate mutase [Hymenobacter profundi]MBW3129770.1 2,3-bisphosphoglycerate-dependent phosphoglycerate mutase [Hymenobacter profundi]